ncbi:MAG: hypothetical protein KF801_07590 [Cryobacterium sp.]|nr:hypothetical protein [Cryobacterium sp.]
MTTHTDDAPLFVPVLSAGKHRTPRSGGCFMEFASYLAGERWSDHPACTHPALAFLARMTNDCTSDRNRSQLAELIPSVIGVNGDDPRIELLIALRVAMAALPIASESRQRALAVGILSCELQLTRLGHPPSVELRECMRAAFEQAPLAARWAKDFVAENKAATRERAISRMTESVIRVGVLGIAQACSPGADARLREVLRGAIADCAAIFGPRSLDEGLASSRSRDLEEAVEADRSHDSVPRY